MGAFQQVSDRLLAHSGLDMKKNKDQDFASEVLPDPALIKQY